MSGYLMEHLIDLYQDVEVFVFNNNMVRIGLKDVVYIRTQGCLSCP